MTYPARDFEIKRPITRYEIVGNYLRAHGPMTASALAEKLGWDVKYVRNAISIARRNDMIRSRHVAELSWNCHVNVWEAIIVQEPLPPPPVWRGVGFMSRPITDLERDYLEQHHRRAGGE